MQACVVDALTRLHRKLNLSSKRVEGYIEALRDLVVLCQTRVAQTVFCDGKLLESFAELRVVLERGLGSRCLCRVELGQARKVGWIRTKLERTASSSARESVVERLVNLFGTSGGRHLGEISTAGCARSPRGDAVTYTCRELSDALLQLGLLT